MSIPIAYFLTYGAYGAHLHGDERGSFEGPVGSIPKNDAFAGYERRAMWRECVVFDSKMRAVIVDTTREVCRHRNWELHAVHARTEHVHVVVGGNVGPERMMSDLKAWTTRRFAEHALIDRGARVWARHGSTRYLWTRESIARCVQYVIAEQGTPMERWPDEWVDPLVRAERQPAR